MYKGFARFSFLALFMLASMASFWQPHAAAATFNQNNIMDDVIFDNYNSMNASQIDTWLNGFSSSCISPNSGFLAVEPIGYNPSDGYQYGGNVTAGTVIADAAQTYNINPQVLLTTLQKEQSLVKGDAGCSTNRYAKAVGYSCPDSNGSFSYTGVNIYTKNGTTYTATDGGICVKKLVNGAYQPNPAAVGFSQQVIRAAWLLKYSEQRAEGNVNWAVVKGNWNNSDDLNATYSGYMAEGCLKRSRSESTCTSYDGYTTIDGTAVHIDSGATAALYRYTPHFSGNTNFVNIFTSWFGSTYMPNLPGCPEATGTARACVWRLNTPSNSGTVFTSSVKVRNELYANEGYSYQGMAFFANAGGLSGNLAVYRATTPNGASFLTTSLAEYNAVVSAGYTGNGIDFYADPPGANTGYPVYRLYNPNSQAHYWATTYQDQQTMLSNGWQDEGVAFTSISPYTQPVAPPSGEALVYRFYIAQTHSHFWTTDPSERDSMIKGGYQYEGVAWNSSISANKTAVYRLYAPAIQQHLWTTDANERDSLVRAGGWNYEGISQYVSTTTNSSPIYRLYAPSLGVHLLSNDSHERDVLVASGGWRNEGVAWYQP